MKNENIRICEEPFCEHCGEGYVDFGIEISDDNTSWCLDCYMANGNEYNLSEEDIEELIYEYKKLRTKKLLIELMELEKNDEE